MNTKTISVQYHIDPFFSINQEGALIVDDKISE